MSDGALLDEKLMDQKGPWQWIRRWWRGVHAQRGKIIFGLTGLETVEDKECFVPLHTFFVRAELPITLDKSKAA